MFATSRDVADFFGKQHAHVVRDIDDLIRDGAGAASVGGVSIFGETRRTHPQNGQSYRLYEMTRDGFTLLVMGFTGKKAMAFKVRYIEEFNRMEATIKALPQQPALPDFTDPGEAAIAWGQQYKARKEAEALALAKVMDSKKLPPYSRICIVVICAGTDWGRWACLDPMSCAFLSDAGRQKRTE